MVVVPWPFSHARCSTAGSMVRTCCRLFDQQPPPLYYLRYYFYYKQNKVVSRKKVERWERVMASLPGAPEASKESREASSARVVQLSVDQHRH